MKSHIYVGITIVAMFFVTSCTTSNLSTVSASITPISIPVASVTPVNTITSTVTVLSLNPAHTQQSLPTIVLTATPTSRPTFTPRPTATSTVTPLPTLPPDVSEALILDLLQNNADCRLPCWWGITPGQSSWSETQNFLKTFASRIARTDQPEHSLYTVYIPVPEEVHPGSMLVHEYKVQGDLIEMIEVGLGSNFQNYALPEFLATYGQPEEIWIRTFEKSRENTLPFYVVLFYPQQGIMARYFDNAERDAEQIRGCPQQREYWPLLWLWSPRIDMTFVDTSAQTVNFGLDEEKAYLPLEEATGMNVETFYQTFKNPDNQDCLETPAALWPPPV